MNSFKVASRGVLASSELVVLGGVPAREDLRRGSAFSGALGFVVDELLARNSLSGTRAFKTLCSLEPAPVSRFFRKGALTENGQLLAAEVLSRLATWPGRFVVTTDELSWHVLTGRSSVYNWRGSIVESTLLPGKLVCCSLPPDSPLPPQCVFSNKWLLHFDWKRFAAAVRLGESFQLPSYELVTGPSFKTALDWLAEAASQPRISADIEVSNEQVSCISVAFTPPGEKPRSLSIPFVSDEGSYFSAAEELQLWLELEKLLTSPTTAVLGQNFTFDASFLLNRYGFLATRIHDTMVAQNIIAPDYPKGLDFITSLWTELPYYKGEGKIHFKLGGRWENLWAYNAQDSLVTELAFPRQLEQLEADGNLAAYDRQRGIIPSLVFMMERGIAVERSALGPARALMDNKVAELRTKLNELVGRELNPASSKQLQEFFYKERGFKPLRSRKTGAVTTDAIALKRLAGKGSVEAGLVLEIHKLEKLSGTYLQPRKLSSDDRWRVSFNPAGTRFSRISSSENIFGKGGNSQNFPHSVQRLLLKADQGFVGYAVDLSNAELRIQAYYGEVAEMIRSYENGVDVHSLMASRIFGVPWQQVLADDKAKVKCSMGSGNYTMRFWGKKNNFSLGYDMALSTFAVQCELAPKLARPLFESYHGLFPEIRRRFHRRVQAELRETGFVTNLLGRRVRFQGELNANTFRDAYASVPQSTVGDIINERGLSFLAGYPEPELELLNQVHDEVVFQLPLSLGFERHVEILKALKSSLEIPLTTPENRSFVIPADITMFKRFKSGLDPAELSAACFEETWEKLCKNEEEKEK